MSGFHEVLFPTGISYGSNGGSGFRTSITTLPSGGEERVQLWEGGRSSYDASFGIKTLEDLAEVQRFHRARRGAAYGFRYKDFLDFHSHPTNPTHTGLPGTQDQEIGVGDGTTVVFQLSKTYVSGATSVTRTIFKPVSGTVRIWVDGVEATEGVDWTVDTTTGAVTFGTAPGLGLVVEASFEFDVPVRFSEEADKALAASVDAFNTGSIPSISLIELLDPDSGYSNEFFYGGTVEESLTANRTLAVGEGFLYRLSAASTGLSVILPDPDNVPDGRAVFLVLNNGSNAFDVLDDSLATLVTVSAGEAARLCVMKTTGSVRSWFAI